MQTGIPAPKQAGRCEAGGDGQRERIKIRAARRRYGARVYDPQGQPPQSNAIRQFRLPARLPGRCGS
jgi:hypothetical protein